MSSENIVNYEAVLADLKARRASLDQAIAAIEPLVGISPQSGGGVSTSQDEQATIRQDSFFGMSIPDATKKYLLMSKKPKSTQEIADALLSGGMTSMSDNFSNSVGSVLNRQDKSGGEIVRVSRGMWGLAEWYPGRKRNKKQNGVQEEDSDLIGDKQEA